MVVAKKLKRVIVTATPADKKLIERCRATEDIDEILELTRHDSAAVRVAALKEMCPCHLKEQEIPDFWTRVLEMVGDSDLGVRKQVLHTLCDGSPASLQVEIMEAMETFNHDTDTDLRRMAHKVIATYAKTGKLNIL